MLRKAIIVGLVVVLVAGLVGYKLYNKPFQDVDQVEPVASMTAKELVSAYQENEQAANEKYLDQFIEVTGQVQEVKEEDNIWTVTLDANDVMSAVRCEMDYIQEAHKPDFSSGQVVTLRGKCTGILMDVVLVRCIEVSH
ncbi:MAG: hypothetical protein KDC57_14195 [Saprospiraceae bacterium]|nr:hypothetical protein [Saprospiraceae bacterium]